MDGPRFRLAMRWALPVSLLVVEYLFLSVLVDLPTSGPAMGLVHAVRLLVPVVIGGGAAGWMLSRRAPGEGASEWPIPPAWRPVAPLVSHLAAFGLTTWATMRLLGPGSPPVTQAALAAWLGCAALAVLLALATAAPLGWTLRALLARWRIPLLAGALGLLSWRAAVAAESLWGVLSAWTLQSVAFLLRLVRPDVVVDAARNLVGAGDFQVLVGPMCSGADGIGLVVIFEAVWISLARSRLVVRRALLLLPLGALAAVVANVVRIAALVLVGAAGPEELAWGGLHSKLGWILFLGIALASIALAERSTWLRRPSPAPQAGDGLSPAAAAYVAPLLAALVAGLVTSIWSDGAFDRWYGLRIAAALAALFLARGSLPRVSLSASWVPVLAAAVVCAAWIPLAGGSREALPDALARLGPVERWSWIAIRVLGFALVIPLVEELAFRGFLLPWLVAPDFEKVPTRAFTWPAVLLSSLAFGSLHPQWMLGTFAGLAFAFARLHRGRLSDAVVAHALANAGIAVAVLWGGRWQLWM